MTYKGDRNAGEIEIIEEKVVFENRYAKVSNDDVIFPGGNRGTYLRVSMPTDRSVGVLPVTAEGKILLIRTFRHGARGWGYEIPKGESLAGEDCETAARRELLEETGIKAERLQFAGEFCESPAVFSGRLSCYIGYGCRIADRTSLENTEAIAGVRAFEPKEYLADRSMDFVDAVTQLMVYHYLNNRGN